MIHKEKRRMHKVNAGCIKVKREVHKVKKTHYI